MTGVVESQACGPQHLSLPFAPQSVAVARHALEDWLERAGSEDDFAEDCRLVVSELVGNAVRHASPLPEGTMDVDWECSEEGFEVAVTDGGGPTRPRRRDAALGDLAGRGLAIVEALTSRWWVERTRSRTTVHALVTAG